MVEKPKSLGKTVLGWFVVQENEEQSGAPPQKGDAPAASPAKPTGDPTVDDLIARYAGAPQAAPAKGGTAPATPPPPPKKGAPVGSAASAATVIMPTGAPGPGLGQPPPLPADAQAAVPAHHQEPGTEAGPEQNGEPVPEVKLDLPKLYQKRGLTADEQSHVERALTLLGNLPKETPADVKRQIVGAALLAFGVPVDRIIEAALLHQRALDTHLADEARETKSLLEEAERRLTELTSEIGRVKKIMSSQTSTQKGQELAVSKHKKRVQEVLDFFGQEAVERVAAASTKLRKP